MASGLATVRSINPGLIGTLPSDADCRVPEGAIACDLKHCENCERLFLRPRLSGRKFCASCCSRMLMPVEDTVYRQVVAELSRPEKPTHLIHYDNSLRPVQYHAVKLQGHKSKLGDWPARLRNALNTMGPLRVNDMARITGHKNNNSFWVSIHQKHIRLIVVGSYWEPGLFYQAARMYTFA